MSVQTSRQKIEYRWQSVYRHKVASFEISYLMIIINADTLTHCYIK